MPAVESKRLDIAQSDLIAAGIKEDDVEVLGGGAFGVVDESNWTVCDQEPSAGESLAGQVRLTVDRECEGDDSLDGGDTPADESTDPSDEKSPSDEPTSEEDGAPVIIAMPDLAGANLQTAQDTLQALGSYVLRQDDAAGLERFQVLDSNWKVCSQTPAAGANFPSDELVVLGVVKLEEPCP